MVRVWNKVRTHHNDHSKYMLELLVCIQLKMPLISQLRIVTREGFRTAFLWPISIARMTFSYGSRVISLLVLLLR